MERKGLSFQNANESLLLFNAYISEPILINFGTEIDRILDTVQNICKPTKYFENCYYLSRAFRIIILSTITFTIANSSLQFTVKPLQTKVLLYLGHSINIP